MSIEDLLGKLLAAVEANTATIKASDDLRRTAIETVKSTAAPVKAAAAAKVEPAAAAKVEPAAAATTGEDRVSDDQAKQLQEKLASYMSGVTRPEELVARKEKARKLLQHDAIKVPGTPADKFDTANVKASAFDVFVKNIDGLITKGDITVAAVATEAAGLDL